MTEPLLQVCKLDVTFDMPGRPVEAVRNVTFDIKRGEIRAIGDTERLKRELLGAPTMELHTVAPLNGTLEALGTMVEVVDHGDRWFRFVADDPERLNPRLLRRLDELGQEVLTLSAVPRSLEALYLQIAAQVDDVDGQSDGSPA